MTVRCLHCYQPLPRSVHQTGYHAVCSRSFFGQTDPPILPYSLDAMHELAEQVVRQQITVTGVQPKLSLDLEHQGNSSRLTLVGLWGRYILKPPYASFPAMPEVESLTMHLAAVFGIRTVPHTLIRLQTGELAYLTRRIDRPDDSSKRAMEDFCQLAERQTTDKYSGSMELLSRLINRHSTQAALDLSTLYELTLFCFLTGNADMHLKNFSLWRNNGTVALTPAYDLLATKLLLPSDLEELALPLNGKKSRFVLTDWAAYANYLGLTTKQQFNVHQRLAKRLPNALRWIEDSFLDVDVQETFTRLIQKRASRLELTA